MENRIIVTTPEELKRMIQDAVREEVRTALGIKASVPKPDRCTFDEALEITGVSKSKLYKLTAAKEIPYKRYGNRLIFSRKELIDWVGEQTVEKNIY